MRVVVVDQGKEEACDPPGRCKLPEHGLLPANLLKPLFKRRFDCVIHVAIRGDKGVEFSPAKGACPGFRYGFAVKGVVAIYFEIAADFTWENKERNLSASFRQGP